VWLWSARQTLAGFCAGGDGGKIAGSKQIPGGDPEFIVKTTDPALSAGFSTLSTLWPVMCDNIKRQQHIAATSLSVCGFGRSPVRVICQALGSRSTITTIGCT
jgi:hypothetical protein